MYGILKKNSTPINQDYVITLTKNNFESIDYENKRFCKVINFTKDWNFDDILLNVSKLDPKDYPNAFIFTIDTTKIANDSLVNILKRFLLNFGTNRSIILQLASKKEAKFYYKEENLKDFQDVEEQQVGSSEDFNSFSSFLWHYLNQNLKLETLKNKNLKNIRNSSLILKFLRIFELDEEFKDLLVLKCAAEGSISDILAAANGFIDNNGEICGNELKGFLECEFSSTSVLMTSIQHSNQPIIEFLIKNCSNLIQFLPKDHLVEISTLLYNTNKVDVLCDLLENADIPFPEIKYPSALNNQRLQKIIENRAQFHEFIRTENISEIQKFEKKHPRLKFAYNLENKSALAQALELKVFKAFFYLKSLRFFDHQIGGIEEILKERKAIQIASSQRRENVKISNLNSHNTVLMLATKSSIYNRDENKAGEHEQHDKIKEWFKDIYATKYGCKLLDAAAQCDDLRIVFDFECDSTENVNPSSSSSSKGATYPIRKWIFIGAKLTGEKQREQKIKGVIAHEICHYVMHLVYQNNDNPYYGDDVEAKEQFEEIVTDIKSMLFPQKVQEPAEEGNIHDNSDDMENIEEDKLDDESEVAEAIDDECSGIISTIYTLYNPEDWHPELIVRPVHIQAGYDNDQKVLNNLELKYETLFKFVEDRILPECKKFNLKQRENVKNINKLFGVISNLKSSKLEVSEPKDLSFMMTQQLIVVFTNSPKLFQINICDYFTKISQKMLNIRNIFLATNSLNNDYIADQFEDILNQNQTLNVVVDCAKGLENITEFVTLENKFIFVVSRKDFYKELKEELESLKLTLAEETVNYSWKDLSVESKKLLVGRKVNFQNNSSFSLLKLINGNSSDSSQISPNDECFERIIDDNLLNLLIDKSEISVNNCFTTDKFFKFIFQPRSLTKSTTREDDEIMPETINEQENSHFDKVSNFFRIISNLFFNNSGKNINPSLNQEDDVQETEGIKNIEKIVMLIEELTNVKYVLISDKAGTGKSWIFKFIIIILKLNYPYKWISNIDLKQFIPELLQKDTDLNFESFMVDKILKPKAKFEAEIFKKLYKNGKVCILFDGFDEIAPDCAEFVTQLFQSFEQNGGNQLWIATRDYFKDDLTEKLELEAVYKLDEFTEVNGVELIASYWVCNEMQNKIENCKDDDSEIITEYSEKVEKYKNQAKILVERIPKSQANSIGLPQFYKMIAEITQNKKDSVIDFGMLKLFEECVNIQYERWSQKKGKLRSRANTQSQNKELNYQTLHQLIAMMGLFSADSQFCDLNIANLKQWSTEEIIACGQLIKRGEKYFFNHETFQELYAAKFILRMLRKFEIHPNMWKYLLDFLIVEKYAIVRLFLNDFLKDLENWNDIISNLQNISKSLENYSISHEIITNTLNESLENLADLIINIINNLDKKIIKNVLMENKSTIVMAANYESLFIKILNLIFDNSTKEEMKRFLMKDSTFLLIIATILDEKITDEFIRNVELKIDNNFIREAFESQDAKGENILFYLFRSNNINVDRLKNIFKILKNRLTANQIIDLATNKSNSYKTNLLKIILSARHIEKMQVMWTELDEINKSINNSESLFKFINNIDVENYEKYYQIPTTEPIEIEVDEALCKQMLKAHGVSDEEINSIIQNKDKNVDKFVHLHVIHDKPDMIELTVQNIIEYCSADQNEEIFMSKGPFGRNLLQRAAIESKDIKTHQILWKVFRDFYKTDADFLKFLKIADEQNNNVFHLAAYSTSKEIFIFMIDEIEKIASNEEIRDILSTGGMSNKNLLMSAAVNNNSVELHEYLWTIIRKYFSLEEILKMIKHTDKFGNNFLLFAVGLNTKEVLELTWIEIQNVFDKTEIQAYLSTVNINQENILHILIKGKDSDQKFHIIFDELLVKTFENQENLKDLVMQQNINGDNFFHYVVIYDKPEMIELTVTKFKEIFSNEEYAEILKSKRQVGRNLFQLAPCYSKNIKTHQILWEIFREFYKSDEESVKFLKILLEFDEFNCNVFHNAAKCSSKNIFEFIINELEKFVSNDEIRNILGIFKMENRNLLLLAAEHNNSVELHEYLWKILNKYFNLQELMDMIKHKNEYGSNLLFSAVQFNTKEILELTWIKIKNIVDKSAIQDYLKVVNNQQENILHILIKSNDLEKIKFLWTELENYLTNQQKGELLSQKTTEDEHNVLHYAAKFDDIEFHITLWEFLLNTFENREELKELIKQRDKIEYNFVYNLVIYNKPEIIEFTITIIKESFSNEQYEEIIKSKGRFERNLIQFAACKSKNIETFQILWKTLRDICNVDREFLEFLKIVDDQNNNIFHLAACFTSKEIFEFMIEKIEEIATEEEIRDILSTKGLVKRTVMHSAVKQNKSVEFHEYLMTVMEKYFNSYEIFDIIKHIDEFGNNCFNDAIWENNINILNVIWNKIQEVVVAEESLNDKILKMLGELEIILNEPFDENSAEIFKINWNEFVQEFELQSFIKQTDRVRNKEISINNIKNLNRLASCDTLEIHENIWQILLSACENINDLKELILLKDFNDDIYLHLLIKNGNYATIEYTLNILQGVLSDEQFREVLQTKEEFDRNLLQIAAENTKDIKIHQLLWKIFKELFKTEFLEIIKHVDKNGINILYIAVSKSTAEIFHFMIQSLEEIPSCDEIKVLLTTSGFWNENILQIAATSNKSLKLHKKLWEIIEKYLSYSEILKLINYCDRDGDNIFHDAVFWNIKEIVEFTWTQIKKFIQTKELQTEYLSKKGHRSHNLLELSAENQLKDLEVKKWVENLINEYEIEMILSH